ncbi:hypothetical protein Taro_023918 [Colocasia esculenta]|uniref:CCHC-type domain-containing protein n=1 Tax=Colocasia esculenta TaxID=4460 RepID=A0A843V504_COLES|nr:hypothetical protein [Colocasia esculenta]
MYQGAWQPGQAVAGGQFPVPPPAVPEQQEVEPEVGQPVRQQRSGTGSTRSGQRRAAVSEARTALLERFLRLRPPMFHGEYDPDKAESWTHELERIFETMDCAEEDQVRLAVYQLKGAAHEWWRVQRQTHFQGQRLDQISWQRFLEVFHGEYFPDYARHERRDQFHELVQGDLTVSQYHQRFVRLLRHVPHVAGNDQACVERFIAGLRPDLRWGVMAHMCTTLGEAVAKATALDREAWQPQQQQQGGASSRSSPYHRPAGSRGSATSSSSGSGSSGSSGIRSQFRKLSTRGGGRSRQQRRQSRFAEQSVQQGAEQGSQEPVCYTCGLPGHFRRDCPRGQAPQQQQPVQYAQQPPQYQYPPQQQASRQQQRGQYQQQAQQFPQLQQYQPGYVAFLKATQPLSPSRSCGDRVSFARCAALEGLSRARELSWLVWDAEDSLEFYPVQASQSFFSLPLSSRPRNRESSQQRQGARRAEETGR